MFRNLLPILYQKSYATSLSISSSEQCCINSVIKKKIPNCSINSDRNSKCEITITVLKFKMVKVTLTSFWFDLPYLSYIFESVEIFLFHRQERAEIDWYQVFFFLLFYIEVIISLEQEGSLICRCFDLPSLLSGLSHECKNIRIRTWAPKF